MAFEYIQRLLYPAFLSFYSWIRLRIFPFNRKSAQKEVTASVAARTATLPRQKLRYSRHEGLFGHGNIQFVDYLHLMTAPQVEFGLQSGVFSAAAQVAQGSALQRPAFFRGKYSSRQHHQTRKKLSNNSSSFPNYSFPKTEVKLSSDPTGTLLDGS